MRVTFIIIVSFFLLNLNIYSEESQCSLKIEFIGKEYNNVRLFIAYGEEEDILLIEGTSDDKNNWLFTYSEDIYNMHSRMYLVSPDNDSDIFLEIQGIENDFGYAPIEKNFMKNSEIKCKYDTTLFIPKKHDESEMHVADCFVVINNKDTELMLSYSIMGFTQTMEDITVKKDKNIIIEYPDSHYLIAVLANSLPYYKNKKNIITLYNCFSDKNKKSYWGSYIKEYLEKK